MQTIEEIEEEKHDPEQLKPHDDLKSWVETDPFSSDSSFNNP